MLSLVPSLRWSDLAPAQRHFDPQVARDIVDRRMRSVAGRGKPDRRALERRIDADLVGRFGPWIAGWNWACSEPGGGGPVRGYCCADHSIFTGDQPAKDTVARVVAAIEDWRGFLAELDGRFAELQDYYYEATESAGIEHAARTLLALVLERTHAEDAWYSTFATVMVWFLESLDHRAADVRDIVHGLISGQFSSWCAPAEAAVGRTVAELARRVGVVTGASVEPDALLRWQTLRSQQVDPPFGYRPVRGVVDRDAHADFISRVDTGRSDRRADRMRAALAACRADALSRRPLTLEMLIAWQTRVLGDARAELRSGPAFAKGGRERYGWQPSTLADFERCLAEAEDRRVDPVLRASRAYLDVLFFHPFVDGNSRAARLVLDFILTRAGLTLRLCDPVFLMSRSAIDDEDVLWFGRVVELLVGTRPADAGGPSRP